MGAGLRDCSGILPGGIVLLHGLFDGILELLFYIRPVHADIAGAYGDEAIKAVAACPV